MTEQENLLKLQREQRTRPFTDLELRRYRQTRRLKALLAAQSVRLQMPRKK